MNPAERTQGSSHVSFEQDLSFLSRYVKPIVLTADNGARIAICAEYQARVMTSALAPGGQSLGFINRHFIEARKTGTAFDNYGGEDRFWLGPEGGQYGLYFASSQPFEFEHWQTPHSLQEGAWEVQSDTSSSVSFEHAFSVWNHSQREFKVDVKRTIALFSSTDAARRLGLSVPASLRWVGFSSTNQLTNVGSDPWQDESGLLSIWILGMFAPVPGTEVIVPFDRAASGEIVNDRYFGKVAQERLRVREASGYLLFRADGQSRGKIGLSPGRAKGVLGSYSALERLLTLVLYTKHPGEKRFVNSMWEQQALPYAGDELNSYNDGPPEPGKPPLGGFYEIESSSPAAALAPGQSLSHEHQTYHFSGPEADLDLLARHVLGVGLKEITAD